MSSQQPLISLLALGTQHAKLGLQPLAQSLPRLTGVILGGSTAPCALFIRLHASHSANHMSASHHTCCCSWEAPWYPVKFTYIASLLVHLCLAPYLMLPPLLLLLPQSIIHGVNGVLLPAAGASATSGRKLQGRRRSSSWNSYDDDLSYQQSAASRATASAIESAASGDVPAKYATTVGSVTASAVGSDRCDTCWNCSGCN